MSFSLNFHDRVHMQGDVPYPDRIFFCFEVSGDQTEQLCLILFPGSTIPFRDGSNFNTDFGQISYETIWQADVYLSNVIVSSVMLDSINMYSLTTSCVCFVLYFPLKQQNEVAFHYGVPQFLNISRLTTATSCIRVTFSIKVAKCLAQKHEVYHRCLENGRTRGMQIQFAQWNHTEINQ